MSDLISVPTVSRSDQGEGVPLPFRALARSEVYLFLARAFTYPQEPLDGLWRRACAAVAALGMPSWRQALELPDPIGLETCYQATFIHTTPAEYPPYETQYGQGHLVRQLQAFGEPAAFYRAFGLRPASGERLDHIGTELEFLYFLCYKEAVARFSKNEDGAERWREGQKYFLEQHLERWAFLFLDRLGHQTDGFYARLATLAGTWLVWEATELGAQITVLEEDDLLAAQRLEQFFDRLDQVSTSCEYEP